MINAVVAGAAGRMGKRLVALLHESNEFRVVGAFERPGHPQLGQDAGAVAGVGSLDVAILDGPEKALKGAQVVLDFTAPAAAVQNLAAASRAGVGKQLKDAVARIVTDSRLPGEPKDAEGSHLFTLYQAFATAEQSAAFRAALEGGLAWGEAKQHLYELLEGELGEARERYNALIARPADLEDILLAGAVKARRIATPFLGELREAVGLRSFRNEVQVAAAGKKKAAKSARFVSFRDDDGSFRFRLLDADGSQLLLSVSFADGKSAGATSKRLQAGELDLRAEGEGFALWLDDAPVAHSQAYADAGEREAAMARLAEALAPQEA